MKADAGEVLVIDHERYSWSRRGTGEGGRRIGASRCEGGYTGTCHRPKENEEVGHLLLLQAANFGADHC